MADAKISGLTAVTTPLGGTEALPIVQSSATKKVTVAQLQAAPVAAQTANTLMYLDNNKTPTTNAYLGYDGVNLTAYVSRGYNASADMSISFGGVDNGFVDNNKSSAWRNRVAGTASGQYLYTDAYLRSIGWTNMAYMDWNGNYTLPTGNLVIGTSGKGIDFSATPQPAGMTSELLADYEEGTWTPTDGSGAGLTFSSASGSYTKTGRLVVAEFYVTYPATADTNGAKLGGLPYSAVTGNLDMGAFITYTTYGTGLAALIATTTANFYTGSTQITNVNMTLKNVRGVIVYQT